MDIEDPENFSVDDSGGNTNNDKPYNYGQEVWCNLEG